VTHLSYISDVLQPLGIRGALYEGRFHLVVLHHLLVLLLSFHQSQVGAFKIIQLVIIGGVILIIPSFWKNGKKISCSPLIQRPSTKTIPLKKPPSYRHPSYSSCPPFWKNGKYNSDQFYTAARVVSYEGPWGTRKPWK
jgi:hypothetical protein